MMQLGKQGMFGCEHPSKAAAKAARLAFEERAVQYWTRASILVK
jgi:hypothetical protein